MNCHVLNLLPSISRLSGGVAPAVMESVALQRCRGVDARVVTLTDKYTSIDGTGYGVPYEAVPTQGIGVLRYSPRLLARLLSDPRPSIVHSHGLWMSTGYVAMRLCSRLGVPGVISPHGMLEPWAWSRHRLRKAPVWWLWERRRLHEATALVATSEMEAVHLRQLGLRNPIAVVPIGINMPNPHGEQAQNTPRVALFLSRIHPKKGLLMLVEAVARLRPQGWRFVVAGPSEGGHEKEVQTAVKAAGLEAWFTFPGPVHGPAKCELYRNSDLFVLPTYSENFGVVIPEALACEVPVLTTRGTPWHDLEAHNCGWWVDPNVEGIHRALAEATAAEPAVLRAMGRRGRALVAAKYTWEQSVARTVELYGWVLGRLPLPGFVTMQ